MVAFRDLDDEYVGQRRRRVSPWNPGSGDGGLPTEPVKIPDNMEHGRREYPLLQFWTITAVYSVTLDASWSNTRAFVFDKNEVACGLMYIDSDFPTDSSDPSTMHKLLILSETTSEVMPADFIIPPYKPAGIHDGQHQQNSEISQKWDCYWIMLVVKDAVGIYERIGIGVIHQASFEMCWQGPQWEEIMLG
jgi:hypothetical protein